MSKRYVVLFVIFAVLLAACGQAAQVEPDATATQATLEPAEEPSTARMLARCVAESRQSTPDPTMQALLPSVDPQDWVKGPEDAYVTIIEYSDFQ